MINITNKRTRKFDLHHSRASDFNKFKQQFLGLENKKSKKKHCKRRRIKIQPFQPVSFDQLKQQCYADGHTIEVLDQDGEIFNDQRLHHQLDDQVANQIQSINIYRNDVKIVHIDVKHQDHVQFYNGQQLSDRTQNCIKNFSHSAFGQKFNLKRYPIKLSNHDLQTLLNFDLDQLDTEQNLFVDLDEFFLISHLRRQLYPKTKGSI